MKTYAIKETPLGWILSERDDEGNVWPDTEKATAREVISRLMQLMEVGPLAPQTEPEEVCVAEIITE